VSVARVTGHEPDLTCSISTMYARSEHVLRRVLVMGKEVVARVASKAA
jgi:hypothetical protein